MKFLPSIFLIVSAIYMVTVFARVWEYAERGQVRWASNCDFANFTFLSVDVRSSRCGRECLNNWGCTHFTARRSTCTLKRNEDSWTEVFSATEECGFIPGRSNQSIEPRKPSTDKKIFWKIFLISHPMKKMKMFIFDFQFLISIYEIYTNYY